MATQTCPFGVDVDVKVGKCNDYIQVVPAKLDSPQYKVTRKVAEQMVARGSAKWIPGLRRIKELNSQPRGERREWRKTASYDPDSGATTFTMQLVPPRVSRRTPANVTPNNKTNRKRMKSSPRAPIQT